MKVIVHHSLTVKLVYVECTGIHDPLSPRGIFKRISLDGEIFWFTLGM